MTKEKLWENWADPSGWCEYMERGYPLSETKKDFFKDLEAWYETRHIAELNAIKEEVILSFKEMEEALKGVSENEVEHRRSYDCYD